MSALGQKQTFYSRHVRFTPNSDIDCVFRHVCFGPIADIDWLFDQLVSTSEQLAWYLETKRLRGREIDEELEVGRLYDWQVSRFLAL